jgi:hypothetical protein
MPRLWSVDTTHGEDVFWFLLCVFALFTIHWSVTLALWALHFLFTKPKETEIRM